MTPHHTGHRTEQSAVWTIIIPVKDTGIAKSRLAPFSQPDRAMLALAFVLDAASAAMECADVRRVLAVTDDKAAARALRATGVEVTADEPAAGLNAAVSHGFRRARESDPAAAVAAMCGDLPALRPSDLSTVFELAAGIPCWFVADAAGVGTTMLAAAPHASVEPAFGPASRLRHRALGSVDLIAALIDGEPGDGELGDVELGRLRRDVDTLADLAEARSLRLGPHSRAALMGIDAA